jgi:hypothetical protein
MNQLRHLQYLIDRSLESRARWNQEEIVKREAWRAEMETYRSSNG